MANTAIVETPHGLAHPAPLPESVDKALCHPHRPMYADGLCENCTVSRASLDRLMALMPEGTPQIAPLSRTDMSIREAMATLYRNVEFAEGVAEYARALMVHSLPEYAQLLLEAARVAAKDGDSRPMEFALKFAKMIEGKTVVEAQEKGAAAGKVATGVQVMIGVQMGGLPEAGVLSAKVVQVEPA